MSYQTIKRHVGSLNAYHWVKEADLENLMLCDSNSMTFWKRQSDGGSKKHGSCQGLAGRGNGQSTEGFGGSENADTRVEAHVIPCLFELR